MERGRLEELFARFRDRGDVAALGEVFDATAADLLRVARRVTRDRAEAEDVLQSTFLAAIEGAKGFDPQRELRAWLVGILVRQAGLARRRRNAPVPSEAVRPKSGPDPAEALVAREFSESIALALEKLSPEDREVLVPLLVDGRRAVDIARELDRRPDTISMRIHRGLARLRRLLAPGIGLGWIATLLARRGLASVRREVLLRARWTEATGLAAPVAAGIGGTILVNKVILSAAVILALVCAWFGVNRISIAARNSSRIDAGRSGLSALEPTRTERSGKVDGSGRPESSLRTAIDAVRAAGTILEIVDPDGRTAAVTSVVIARDGQPVRDCETDSKGRLELETSGETVRVYVLRPRTMPFRAEITLDGSEHRVVLPLGQEVSGRVRVDRKPPERPLRIRLAFADLPFPGSQERSEIARRLGCEEYEGFVLPEETQADGSFRWSGLPVDWSGTICFPFQYTLSTAPPRCFGDQWLGLDEPAVGLSVDLDTLPALRGRVVDDSTGAAIPKAQVSYEIKWAGLDSTTECGATADDSGRFVIPLQQPDLEHVEITLLRDARGRGRARSGQHWESIRAPLDLGDVMIQRPQGRELAFVVQDASGRPIAGALGFVGGGASRPTDQEGRGLLESVPVETHRFQLRARGFWSRTVEISDPIDGPIVVALEAGNQLSVEVTGLEVGSLRQPAMQLVSGSPLFVNSGGWLPEWPMSEVLTGFCRSAQFENEDRKQGIAQCSLDETGRFVVEDLKPGEPITLRILGPFDRILHEEAVAPLGPTERRQLSIRLEGGPSDLRGRVRSDDGASIARAKVLIVDRDGRRDSRTTGRDGEFGFPGVPEGEYRLSAEKRGWVPSETALVLAGAGNPQTEIRMQRGHDLTVEVLDSHGALVPPALVLARDPATDHVWQGHEDRAGRIHIYDLPPISCALSVTVAGDVIERVHDALVPLVRIEVPALGRVEVEWSRHAATDTRGDVGCQIALRPIDQAHGPLTHWTASTQQRGSYLFPAVFAGEYTVQLERLFQTDDNGSTRPEPVGSPVRVFVESNQTAHVTL